MLGIDLVVIPPGSNSFGNGMKEKWLLGEE